MSQDQINITDMQCRIFRMAQKKWNLSPDACADLFKQYDILGFISECYDVLRLSSYQCALSDVEELLRNRGVDIPA